MAGTAVDTWARDMASEAKELAVLVNAKHDSHEAKCNERHSDQMSWQERMTHKVDGVSSQMWKLAIAGIVSVLGGFAVITWSLLQHFLGLP